MTRPLRHDWQPTDNGSWDGGWFHMGQTPAATLWAPPWWWFLTSPKERGDLKWGRKWRPWKVWMWPRYLHSRATNTVTWLD